MKIEENENALQGQHNLAQSNALGWKTGVKMVCAITIFVVLSLFRTKRRGYQFRPQEIFALIIVNARTVFPLSFLPQALPVDRLNRPFRPILVYKE